MLNIFFLNNQWPSIYSRGHDLHTSCIKEMMPYNHPTSPQSDSTISKQIEMLSWTEELRVDFLFKETTRFDEGLEPVLLVHKLCRFDNYTNTPDS